MPHSALSFDSSPFARRVGEHSIWEESSDTLHIQLIGILHGEHLAEIMAIQDEWSQNKSHYFVLANVQHLDSVDRGARPVMTEDHWPKTRPQIVAVYGAKFSVRTIGDMVVRARRALHGGDPMPTRFFATLLEARKQIEILRRAKS